MKVAVLDYGIGNLFSIKHSLQKIGLNVEVTSSIKGCEYDGIVLPGVGNFKTGAKNLGPLREDIIRLTSNGVPLLGICLGMQLLFEESQESDGGGLALLRGKIIRLPGDVKTPHMGWNNLHIIADNEILDGIDEKDYFYFVHSYYARPADKSVIVAETEYGIQFASVVAEGNIYGTQFHPEKSGRSGCRILRNFMMIMKR
ncbi:imidazole glycerol phosphate synthase subunit HisH [Candidatus Bathyarchaeota archaeon]|nr:imidazole glycerol phosphate synthase subunit HisH [Candidatus Bathyarchaeota archaeon]